MKQYRIWKSYMLCVCTPFLLANIFYSKKKILVSNYFTKFGLNCKIFLCKYSRKIGNNMFTSFIAQKMQLTDRDNAKSMHVATCPDTQISIEWPYCSFLLLWPGGERFRLDLNRPFFWLLVTNTAEVTEDQHVWCCGHHSDQHVWCCDHHSCLSSLETRVQALVGPLLRVLK